MAQGQDEQQVIQEHPAATHPDHRGAQVPSLSPWNRQGTAYEKRAADKEQRWNRRERDTESRERCPDEDRGQRRDECDDSPPTAAERWLVPSRSCWRCRPSREYGGLRSAPFRWRRRWRRERRALPESRAAARR